MNTRYKVGLKAVGKGISKHKTLWAAKEARFYANKNREGNLYKIFI